MVVYRERDHFLDDDITSLYCRRGLFFFFFFGESTRNSELILVSLRSFIWATIFAQDHASSPEPLCNTFRSGRLVACEAGWHSTHVLDLPRYYFIYYSYSFIDYCYRYNLIYH